MKAVKIIVGLVVVLPLVIIEFFVKLALLAIIVIAMVIAACFGCKLNCNMQITKSEILNFKK